MLRLAALALVLLLDKTLALDNGVGLTPVMGWSSWMVTGQGDLWTGSPFNVTARALLETADTMKALGLVELGYEYVLLDDGWPSCSADSRAHPTACQKQPGARIGDCGCTNTSPRLDNGDVLVDPVKFPPSAPGLNDGIKVVADALHKKGLQMGIYTAPHGRTCGGYWGMLGHERTDAKMYELLLLLTLLRLLLRLLLLLQLQLLLLLRLLLIRRSLQVRRLGHRLHQAGHGLPLRRLHPRRDRQGLPGARARRPQRHGAPDPVLHRRGQPHRWAEGVQP